MALNVVIPSNLDADFTIDAIKTKIYNNSVLIGAGAPATNPPVEEKVWLWAQNDSGGVAGDYALSHIWEPATLTWEPLGASVDFRLSNVSVNTATGEVTFTITDPVSGTTSDIVTDLTDLVDVQETVTSLVEFAPGLLQYTDEDLVVNDVDVSGLRDTGQTAQRVEVIGDTFNIIPNGVDTRVVVDNASSTATFVDGTTTAIHYTGDNVLGMGISGDSGVVMTPDGMALSYVIEPAPGVFQGGVIAADPGLSPAAGMNVIRNTSRDESTAEFSCTSDAGLLANGYFTAKGASNSASGTINIQAPSGNAVYQNLDASSTGSSYVINVMDNVTPSQASMHSNVVSNNANISIVSSNSDSTSSFLSVSDPSGASCSLGTEDSTNGFDTNFNAVSNDTSSSLHIDVKQAAAPLSYLDLETDGTISHAAIGSSEPGTTDSFAKTTYDTTATDQTVLISAATSTLVYSNVELFADATNSGIQLTSNDGVTVRNVTVAPSSIEIGAGDVVSNAVGGADGDVLVRFGTGSEVRYASIGSVVGAELNVNTATPALEVVVGGSVVDTVGLVDVLDAFNVHQFYAIP